MTPRPPCNAWHCCFESNLCCSCSYPQNILAKALYDNVAESPDELSFRKGDIMTVLERDTQGLDGWWLCSLHGRQGIVPGNRVKILVGMYDGKNVVDSAAVSSSSPHQNVLPQSAYAKPVRTPSTAAMVAPAPGLANKVLPSTQYTSMHLLYSTPNAAQPSADSIYMMPPSHSPKASLQNLYQVPGGPSPSPQPGLPSKDLGTSQRKYQLSRQDVYQVPSPMGHPPTGGGATEQEVYQVPPYMDKSNFEASKKPVGKVSALVPAMIHSFI